MQKFNGLEYLCIDIAGQAGKDKLSWDDRINWVKTNINQLESLVPDDPKTKFLYIKAVHTLRNIDKPTGFVMALDATNSGVQVMAALGKCGISARTCNLINTGIREDLYGAVLTKLQGVNISRDKVKEAIIPMLYGSKAAPRELFGEGTKELKAFVYAVESTIPILGELRALMDSCWGSNKKYHQFTMPDGHVVKLPTMVMHQERVEIFDTSFTYQWKDVGVSDNSTALLAHLCHATDAYIAREMVRRCDFELAHIHDAYFASPIHMNEVRQTYIDIMSEIAESDLLESIMKDLTGESVKLNYDCPDLYLQIRQSEYMLS
jgi:hypothetical protein